ncbi:SigE family RNA polymerase sigma factor [Nonomuraea typhae]|uniref:SigE family RNA polymerase sigma factor n=1 Tax=Nonomuraea typhae TaxID=2603600 RepID=A0ABW7YKA5_9ACTN
MGEREQTREEEFHGFVMSRWPGLMRTAYLLTGDRHAAEDLVQSALERAYVAWRRVSAADDPDAYVRRILINVHARRHRRGLKEFLMARGETPEQVAGGDTMAQAEDRSMLMRALAGLPARQREAVVLRYWEDLTETQAAAAMGCSAGTVKSNAAKGIAKLRAIPGLMETAANGGVK